MIGILDFSLTNPIGTKYGSGRHVWDIPPAWPHTSAKVSLRIRWSNAYTDGMCDGSWGTVSRLSITRPS